MTKTSVGIDFDQPSDVLLDFPAKVTLHLVGLGDFRIDLGNIPLCQVLDADGPVNTDGVQNFIR